MSDMHAFQVDETSAGTPSTTATGCHPPLFCPFRFRPLSFSLRLEYLVRWMTLDIQVDMPVVKR